MKLPACRSLCAWTLLAVLIGSGGGCASLGKPAPATPNKAPAAGKKVVKNNFPDAAEVGLEAHPKSSP